MVTGLIYSDRFLEHETGPVHPERPERLKAIVRGLQETGLWDRLVHLPFVPAEKKWIERLHDPVYVRRLFAACESGGRSIDTVDCPIGPTTAEIAQLAVGGVLAAVDAVMAADVDNAFCAVRPPGHHAERDRAMGFCYFGNVAIAADYLTQHYRLQRVAVVDFDVHHGNGTQHLLEDRDDVFVITIHESPVTLYPGTGFATECGRAGTPGEGYTLNVPMDPHGGDDAYRRAFIQQVLPALDQYKPQFLLVSAGFDASEVDPLAHMNLTPAGYQWMTQALLELAGNQCSGRLVSVLEGGYDLHSLRDCVLTHVRTLMGEPIAPA